MCNGNLLLMQNNGNLINYFLKKCVMVMLMAMMNLQCNGNLINYLPK